MHSTAGAVRKQEPSILTTPSDSTSTAKLGVLRNIVESYKHPACRGTSHVLTPKNRLRLLDHLAVQISDRTDGQIFLYGPTYRNRWIRLWMLHTRCRRWFRASISEFNAVGDDSICPHCTPTTDVSRFGSAENLNHYVQEQTRFVVEFLDGELRGYRSQYRFFCRDHQRIYVARLADVISAAGITNGCPDCQQEHGRWSR